MSGYSLTTMFYEPGMYDIDGFSINYFTPDASIISSYRNIDDIFELKDTNISIIDQYFFLTHEYFTKSIKISDLINYTSLDYTKGYFAKAVAEKINNYIEQYVKDFNEDNYTKFLKDKGIYDVVEAEYEHIPHDIGIQFYYDYKHTLIAELTVNYYQEYSCYGISTEESKEKAHKLLNNYYNKYNKFISFDVNTGDLIEIKD